MFLRRETWAQLTRAGVPALFVIRPKQNFTPALGKKYSIADSTNKLLLQRARQLYEQKHLGVAAEMPLALARNERGK